MTITEDTDLESNSDMAENPSAPTYSEEDNSWNWF